MKLGLNKTIELSVCNVINTGSYTSSSFTIYNGLDNSTKAAPCVIVSAHDAMQEGNLLGLYNVKISVIVKEKCEDTTINSSSLYDEVTTQLFAHSKNDYNVSGSLSVFDIFAEDQSAEVTDDTFIQTLNMSMYCIHS